MVDSIGNAAIAELNTISYLIKEPPLRAALVPE
jgi:hypothetical protein